MFLEQVAIQHDAIPCLHGKQGMPEVDTPLLVSSEPHNWDVDPTASVLDLQDHSPPSLSKTTVADEHHRIPLSLDPGGAR